MSTQFAATETLTAMIQRVLDTHHVYMRNELPYLERTLARMCANHGQERPELFTLQQLLQNLRDDITAHLEKEEQVLFPYVTGLEAAAEGKGMAPHACFPSVNYPIRVMLMEHDTAQDILAQMRATTANYSVPPGFCENGTEFYRRLAAMDADLKEHIRVENDILFPRAVELERNYR